MAEVTLQLLGTHIETLIGEVREMRAELTAMRTELDGQFQMITGRGAGWEGLARLVAEQGRRISALERKP